MARPARQRRELPEVGGDWLTWDPVLKQIPNRPERRWGTAKLIATIRRVLASWHLAHPEMPQLLIGDLSRPHGGVFDERYGGLGHASHQNGLDADIYYPRQDHRLLAAYKPDLIDRPLAQDLLDRFVAEGVQFVFIGTRTHLHGPARSCRSSRTTTTTCTSGSSRRRADPERETARTLRAASGEERYCYVGPAMWCIDL